MATESKGDRGQVSGFAAIRTVVRHSGSIASMVRDKATITLDRRKAQKARALTGSGSVSAVIDLALDRLIQTEQLRRDVAAYARGPLTDDELAVGDLPVELDLADDDVDYEALYGIGE